MKGCLQHDISLSQVASLSILAFFGILAVRPLAAAPVNSLFNPNRYTSVMAGELKPLTSLSFNTSNLTWSVDGVLQGTSGIVDTTQTGSPGEVEAAVFTFDAIRLSGLGANVSITGHRAVVLVSKTSILVRNTTLSVNAENGVLVGSGQTLDGGAGGPGAEGGIVSNSYNSTSATIRGKGGVGSSGGTPTDGVGYGGGKLGGSDSAGNGGGYGGLGGEGRYSTPPYLGPIYGEDTIIRLYGGSGGSGGRIATGDETGSGGGGGGAIELSALTTLTLDCVTIRANGGSGGGSNSARRGGGGGSGGGIILGCNSIVLTNSSTVIAKGGDGGRAANGTQYGGS
ncbi:MAG: hypothetical protein JW951_09565, partial [Lentisphaerae bacterium]|nr:hypothetical protein [Lentisphaerota bacterium]